MPSILDLSSEPFASVIARLSNREWTALWLSGDLRIQSKLTQGKGVREVEFGWPLGSKCLWPPQISQLAGLETFSY